MWNTMQIETVAGDATIRPLVGPGDLTREQAHAEVQRTLDRLAAVDSVARRWREGKDDSVRAGTVVWCIYEYDDTAMAGAMRWLDEHRAILGAVPD